MLAKKIGYLGIEYFRYGESGDSLKWKLFKWNRRYFFKGFETKEELVKYLWKTFSCATTLMLMTFNQIIKQNL